MSIFNKLVKNTVAAVTASTAPSQTPQSAPVQPTSPAASTPTGEAFAPINDVSLEQYAELAALMKDTGNDQEKCVAMVQKESDRIFGIKR